MELGIEITMLIMLVAIVIYIDLHTY